MNNNKHYHYAKFNTDYNVIQLINSWTVTDQPNIKTVALHLSNIEKARYQDASTHNPSTWDKRDFADVPGEIIIVSEQAAVVLTTDDNTVWCILDDDTDLKPEDVINQAFASVAV